MSWRMVSGLTLEDGDFGFRHGSSQTPGSNAATEHRPDSRARCQRPREAAISPGVDRALAELEADAEELVVLGDAIGAGEAPGLDLPGVGRDGEVGDERVLGLARAVADDRAVAGCASAMRMQSSVSVSVPIWFSLMRMAFAVAGLDAAREALDVRDEEVVADELHACAEPLGHRASSRPSRPRRSRPRCETIGYLRDERARRWRRARSRVTGFLSNVYLPRLLVEELARGAVERERDVLARLVAGLLDGPERRTASASSFDRELAARSRPRRRRRR